MVAALIVGALTAWYLGLRIGIISAAVTAGALVVAMFVPGLSLAVYALVIAWAAVLYFLGPKLSKKSNSTLKTAGSMLGGVGGMIGSGVSSAKSWANKFLNREAK
jgi:hypothetical protein